MPGVVHPAAIEVVVAVVDQTMNHRQHLPFHGGECLGGLDLDQVLVEGDHDPRKRQHEVGEGRGHVANKGRRGGIHRLGDELVGEELGVIGNEGRLLGHPSVTEILLDFTELALQGNHMGLQKTGDVTSDVAIDAAQGGVGGFGNGENPVEVFQVGLSGFFRSGHERRIRAGVESASSPQNNRISYEEIR